MPRGITWYHFQPNRSGSFGREDMGEFCQVDGVLFIIPAFEQATINLERNQLEAQINTILSDGKRQSVYELFNGELTSELNADWRAIIEHSTITDSRQ